MAGLGGILAGALGGGAAAAQGMAQGAIEDERRLSISEQLSRMEEARQMRIAEANEVRRRAGRQADIDQDITNAPRVAESQAASASTVARAKNTVDNEDVISRGSDPAYLKAKKAEANASRADPQYSPSELANAEATRMAVGDERERRRLLQEKEDIETGSMRGDQRTRALAAVERKLAALQGRRSGGKDETDTVRRVDVEFRTDPLTGEKTGESRTETTEKRRANPGAPAAKSPAAAPTVPAPQAAIDYLKQNPNMRQAFDQKYGAGSAAKVLGR